MMDYTLNSKIIFSCWRQRGRAVRESDLKSRDPEFKSRSDHLFQVVPGSTPQLCLYKVGILNLLSLFQLCCVAARLGRRT